MAKNVNHVSLIKSTNTAITSGDSVFIASGQTGPKLPTPDVLIQGEIAVNLAKGVETLSIKNTDNEIVTFSSDKIIKKVIVDNERITAAALNDLEVNKQDVLTAGQGIDITNNVISATLDITVDDALDSGSTNPVANSAITSEFDEIKNIIDENELIIASALNDLEERKLDASAYTPTDLTDLYILSGKVDDNAFVTASALNDLNDRKLDASAYTPTDLTGYATEEWVEGKLGSGFTGENSGNTVTKVIEDNELAISAALNDLNDRKLDASAYTPTDLSDLYALSAVVSANSVVTAAALNDLNTRLLPTITGVSFNEQLAYVEDGVAYLDDISAHTHSISEVDGLQASLNSKVSGITVNNATKSPTNGVINLGTLVSAATLNGSAQTVTNGTLALNLSANYDSNTKKIYLKSSSTTISEIDATDFIKDGMVNDVKVDEPTSGDSSGVTCLIVTFNTDAGKEDIEIPLSRIFDSNLYYTKTEIDDKLGSGFTGENSGNTVTEIIEENELIVASALNDLEERKLDASAYTPTDLSDLYILSGKVDDNATVTAAALNDLNERLYDKLDASAYTQVEVDFELDSGSTNPVANSAITTAILENEEVVSEALADLDSRISGNTTYINQVNAKADTIARSLSGYTPSGYSYSKGEVEVKLADKLDASAYTPTDLSGYYTKQEIDNNKLGSGFTGDNSGVTVTQAINETETVVAAALNDLNDRIDSLDGDIDALESAIQNIDLPTIDGDSDLWSSGSTGVPATSALTEVLEEIEEVTATALNDLNDKIAEVSGNQLTADSFKTINNESIIGTGNIEIQGGGGGEMNVITGISVNNVEQSPSNKVVNITVPTSLSQITSAHTHSEYINTGSTAQTKNGNLGVNNLIVRGSNTSNSTRFITSDAANNIYASINGTPSLVVTNTEVRRGQSASSINLGSASYPWNNAYAKAFVTSGGTSAQFVKGDGTLDSTVYAVAANTISGVSVNGSAVTVTNNVAAISGVSLEPLIIDVTAEEDENWNLTYKVASGAANDIHDAIVQGREVYLKYDYEASGGDTYLDYYSLASVTEELHSKTYTFASGGLNDGIGKMVIRSLDGRASTCSAYSLPCGVSDMYINGSYVQPNDSGTISLNLISGVSFNGTDATVTNGKAAISAETGTEIVRLRAEETPFIVYKYYGTETVVTADQVVEFIEDDTKEVVIVYDVNSYVNDVNLYLDSKTTSGSNIVYGFSNVIRWERTTIPSRNYVQFMELRIAKDTGTTPANITSTLNYAYLTTETLFNDHTNDTTVHVTPSDKSTWNGKQDALSNASVLTGITSAKVTQWDNAISGVSLNGTAATVTNHVAALTGVATTTDLNTHTGDTTVHVTAANKTQWNNAISGVSLNGTAATVTNHVAALTGVATTANVSTHSGTTIPSATSSQMHLPAVTAADNGKILMVVNGQWALVNPTTIYTGSGTPSSGQGNDGDIYLQTS